MVTGSSNLIRRASCKRDAWKPQVRVLDSIVVSCSDVLQGNEVAPQKRRKKVLPKTPRRGAGYHSVQSLLEVSTGGIRTGGCMDCAWNVHDAMLLPRGNHLVMQFPFFPHQHALADGTFPRGPTIQKMFGYLQIRSVSCHIGYIGFLPLIHHHPAPHETEPTRQSCQIRLA